LLKNLHQLSLQVVNLASNQNKKMLVMSAEPITATQQLQTCQSITQKINTITAAKKPQQGVNL
jgi:hypothetical protein